MPLILPQYVKMRNARLQICATCMNVAVFALVVCQFVAWRQYGKYLDIEGEAEVFTLGEQNVSRLVMLGTAVSSSPTCTDPQLSDYWYDASGSTSFTNHSCIRVCQNASSQGCVNISSLVVRESHNSVILVSQFQNREHGVHNYFTPFVEGIQLNFAYAFGIPKVPWYYIPEKPKQWDLHSSQVDYSTAIMTHTKQLWGVVLAGFPIALTLQQMLSIAGIPSLDTLHSLAGRNYLPGASGERAKGPIKRVAGLELHAVVDCSRHNTDRDKARIRGLVSGPTCVLTMEAAPSTWVHVDFKLGSAHGTAHGVRVKTITKGTELAIDLASVYINIAASAVFFQLPHALIFVTALFLCGHLSTIYRSLIYRRFSITKEAGAMAMRLLEHEVAFNELEAPGENHDGAGHISKAVIAQSLGHVMERRGNVLDKHEMDQMIDFCLNTVSDEFNGQDQVLDEGGCASFLNEACDGLNTFLQDMRDSFGFNAEAKAEINTMVDLDRFASACSSAEPISFDALVKLFDKDRSVGFMETFFMPKKFRESIQSAKRRADEEENLGYPGAKRQGSICTDLVCMKEKMSDFHDRLSAHMTERQEMLYSVEALTAKADDFTNRIKEHQERVDLEQKKASERIQQLAEQVADIQQQLTKSGEQRKTLQDKASTSSFLRGTAETLQLANQVQALQSELKHLGHNLGEQQARHKLEQQAVQDEVEKLNAEVSRLHLSTRSQYPILRDARSVPDTASAGKDRNKLEVVTLTVPRAGDPEHEATTLMSKEQSRSKRDAQSKEDVAKVQDARLVSMRGSADSPVKPVCSNDEMLADLQIRACAIHDFIDDRIREIQTELKVQVQMHLQAVCAEFQSLPRASIPSHESTADWSSADWLFAP